MERILITGGFGFVGTQLQDLFSSRGDIQVWTLDNLLAGKPESMSNRHAFFMLGDIRDKALMRRIIPTYDTIIHLAAIVGEPACVIDPQFSYDVNVEGTRNILSAMSRDQRLIFMSTSSVYGNRPNEIVTEESEPLPINNYARHKYQSELDIQQSGLDYIILRPVTAFGVTHQTRLDLLVNTLIYEALTTKKIVVFEPNIMRPIIHVKDFARAIDYAVSNRLDNKQIYNIGDSRYRMTKLKLAEFIATICGAEIVHKDEQSLDPRNYDVSFDKLMSTGFTFSGARILQAVQEISKVCTTIMKDPQAYSTPYKVKQYLDSEKGL